MVRYREGMSREDRPALAAIWDINRFKDGRFVELTL